MAYSRYKYSGFIKINWDILKNNKITFTLDDMRKMKEYLNTMVSKMMLLARWENYWIMKQMVIVTNLKVLSVCDQINHFKNVNSILLKGSFNICALASWCT